MKLGRRGFLGALAAAAVGVAARLHLPALPAPIRMRALHYKGVPIIVDTYARDNQMYFINNKYWKMNR